MQRGFDEPAARAAYTRNFSAASAFSLWQESPNVGPCHPQTGGRLHTAPVNSTRPQQWEVLPLLRFLLRLRLTQSPSQQVRDAAAMIPGPACGCCGAIPHARRICHLCDQQFSNAGAGGTVHPFRLLAGRTPCWGHGQGETPGASKKRPAPQLSPSVMRASYSIVVFDYCVGKAGSLGYIYLSLTH
jgi:hypothetical protein